MKRRVLKYASSVNRNLAANPAHNFAKNHTFCIYASNAIYSFIPKNACSTMRLSIALANGCIASRDDFRWIHYNNNTFNANLRDLYCADYTFVILRCPYSRLASTYLDKFVEKTGELWNLYYASNQVFDPDSLSFREFCELLKMPQYLNLNEHWKPQSTFLIYEEYDEYFPFEDFKSVQDVLERKIGLDIVDARRLTKHGTDQYEPDTARRHSDTPAHEIAAMKRKGQCPGPQSLYDADLVKLVWKMYRDDIDLYASHFGTEALTFSSAL